MFFQKKAYNMNRRNFLRHAGILGIGLGLGAAGRLGAEPRDRLPSGQSSAQAPPNFIFFITDDISPHDLGCYDGTRIHTPNLDRIAKQGLVFDNACLTISSCSPSRCSIITGRYPHNTGAPELHTTLPESQHTFVRDLRRAGYYTVLAGKNHMGKPVPLGFETAVDSKPSGAERWIEILQNRPADRPFFCWFASHDAHHGWQINDKAPTYEPEEVPVPPMLYDGPLTRGDLVGYCHEVSRTDYYAGELMKELERQGIAENTYFIYCSDNGRPFPRCKTYLYESGIRTPLIIVGPGVKPGRTDSIVSSIDYAATLLDLAGLAKPDTVQGVSFRELFSNPRARTREVAFAERNWHVCQLHERMVRAGDWLYIWNAWPDRHNVCSESAAFSFPAAKELWSMAEAGRLTPGQMQLTLRPQPEEQLFNIKTDPDQFDNLASRPEHEETRRRMRSLLEEWKRQTGDSVPKNPTPDRQPLHEAGGNGTVQRGDFPGADNKAQTINHPGPIRLSEVFDDAGIAGGGVL